MLGCDTKDVAAFSVDYVKITYLDETLDEGNHTFKYVWFLNVNKLKEFLKIWKKS